jgi:hypothetical protein
MTPSQLILLMIHHHQQHTNYIGYFMLAGEEMGTSAYRPTKDILILVIMVQICVKKGSYGTLKYANN